VFKIVNRRRRRRRRRRGGGGEVVCSKKVGRLKSMLPKSNFHIKLSFRFSNKISKSIDN
jgi:hypothetical protein